MRARRVDANLTEIVHEFRRLGCSVHVTNDMWDLTVAWSGVVMLIEVKDGKKPPSKKRLTKRAQEFYKTWKAQPKVVEDLSGVEETVALLQDWHRRIRA